MPNKTPVLTVKVVQCDIRPWMYARNFVSGQCGGI